MHFIKHFEISRLLMHFDIFKKAKDLELQILSGLRRKALLVTRWMVRSTLFATWPVTWKVLAAPLEFIAWPWHQVQSCSLAWHVGFLKNRLYTCTWSTWYVYDMIMIWTYICEAISDFHVLRPRGHQQRLEQGIYSILMIPLEEVQQLRHYADVRFNIYD